MVLDWALVLTKNPAIMKTFRLLSIILVSLIAFITSCEKPAPIASFSASAYSAMVNDLITFTNTSQNATSYNWSFGDGTLSSEQNPTHAYSTAGNFSVQLTATGEGGVSSISNIISIDYPEPVAGFTLDKSTAKIGETVGFTNTSQNAHTFLWNFGDGNVSVAVHPTHSYATAGSFAIMLSATGDGGRRRGVERRLQDRRDDRNDDVGGAVSGAPDGCSA